MNIAWIARATGRTALLLALAMALAACQSAPAAPLLSPIEPGRSYGFSEQTSAPDRYQITYWGPNHRTSGSAASREAEAQRVRDQVFDFAAWRAAQIAQVKGYQGFRVNDRRSNVETTVAYDDYDPFWHRRYRPFPYRGRRYWDPFPYPYYPYASPYAYVRGQITVDVTLLHDLQPGDYRAEDVISQMRDAYPGEDSAFPVR